MNKEFRKITSIEELEGLLNSPNQEMLDKVIVKIAWDMCDDDTLDTDDNMEAGTECDLIGIRRVGGQRRWVLVGTITEYPELLATVYLPDNEMLQQEIWVDDPWTLKGITREEAVRELCNIDSDAYDIYSAEMDGVRGMKYWSNIEVAEEYKVGHTVCPKCNNVNADDIWDNGKFVAYKCNDCGTPYDDKDGNGWVVIEG